MDSDGRHSAEDDVGSDSGLSATPWMPGLLPVSDSSDAEDSDRHSAEDDTSSHSGLSITSSMPRLLPVSNSSDSENSDLEDDTSSHSGLSITSSMPGLQSVSNSSDSDSRSDEVVPINIFNNPEGNGVNSQNQPSGRLTRDRVESRRDNARTGAVGQDRNALLDTLADAGRRLAIHRQMLAQAQAMREVPQVLRELNTLESINDALAQHMRERANNAAARIIAELEYVPPGLIRRLERSARALRGLEHSINNGRREEEEEGMGDASCIICWDKLLDGEGAVFDPPADSLSVEAAPSNSAHLHGTIISLPCAHVFHASCLIPWFQQLDRTTCPTCRFELDPERTVYAPYAHWAPPPAPGPSIRDRVKRNEREAGLRCDDTCCSVGPSDDNPFLEISEAARRMISLGGRDGCGKACAHTFHRPCLLSAQCAGETVPVDTAVCSVCFAEGFMLEADA